jgi:nitrogenase molybdenum-iron protein alpha/beta subunit
MKPTQGCKFFGAFRASSGIRDGITLIHAPVGCHWGAMVFKNPSNLVDVRQACTVMHEREVVFGGEKALQEALLNADCLYDTPVLAVVSGCAPAITGDDMEAVIKDTPLNKKVVFVDSPGFKGGMYEGYEEALVAFGQLMEKPDQKVRKSINLIGVCPDDCRLEADMQEIREMLGDIKINAVIANCTFQEFIHAPRAELNVVFGPGEQLAQLMEKEFDIPYITVEYPYGLEGSRRFLQDIGQRLEVDLSQPITHGEQQVILFLRRIYTYLQNLYSLPVAVIGDPCRVKPMAMFLEREVGLDIEVLVDNAQLEDYHFFEEQVRKSNATMLFGTSFERRLALELNIPLIRYTYPIFDSVYITERPYTGYRGTMNILEDIINGVITHDYKLKELVK